MISVKKPPERANSDDRRTRAPIAPYLWMHIANILALITSKNLSIPGVAMTFSSDTVEFGGHSRPAAVIVAAIAVDRGWPQGMDNGLVFISYCKRLRDHRTQQAECDVASAKCVSASSATAPAAPWEQRSCAVIDPNPPQARAPRLAHPDFRTCASHRSARSGNTSRAAWRRCLRSRGRRPA
jgi:hypothetical protein